MNASVFANTRAVGNVLGQRSNKLDIIIFYTPGRLHILNIKMNIKKELERDHLIKFVSNEKLNLLVYSIDDSETPDFEVNIDKQLVSIEHSRLINPSLQEEEIYREKIIEEAKKKFDEKYPKNKLCSLFTFRNVKLEKGNSAKKSYVEEIYQLVESVYLNNKDYRFDISSRRSRHNKSKFIETFSITNARGFSHWQHFGAYRVDWIDMDWLKGIIKKKENNIKKYKKQYKENWLLLVCDFGTKASSTRTDFTDFSVISTEFDKVYIYSFIADEITVVK